LGKTTQNFDKFTPASPMADSNKVVNSAKSSLVISRLLIDVQRGFAWFQQTVNGRGAYRTQLSCRLIAGVELRR